MQHDVICIGMALVDSIIRGFDPDPVSASGYRAESGSLNVGGEAVNEAVAASKLGLRTGILCSVGNDAAGEMVLSELKRNGVEVRVMPRDAGTPVTTMFVREDGTRQSITNLSHTYNYHPEKEPELFTDAKALIIGSLFRAPFDDPDVIHNVLLSAKGAGQLVIADTKLPNSRFLTLDDIGDSLPLIDYITPNEDEGRHFTGRDDPEEIAEVFLSYGVRNVIIKLGSRGCFFRNRNKTIRLEAFDIDAVDATGAGDNFAAGFCSEILRGAKVEDALKFANACGAICTTAVGAGTALRNREQVISFLEENA